MPTDDAKRTITPKLRFPEFRAQHGWAETLLGAEATFQKGRGVSKAEVDPKGGRFCIRYGELYTRYGEVIREVFSKTNAAESTLFLSRKNDVIVPGSGETKEDIATASCVLLDHVALGGDLNVIRTKHNGIFLSYFLNGPKRKEIAKVAQGDTVVHLYPSQLEELPIAFPTDGEQQKIAACLTSLDEVIAAQGRKVQALNAHKKGLMQQLFPREGEILPRLRFQEFRDDERSEFKAIGEFARVTTGDKDTQDKVDGGSYPFFVRSQNVERIDSFSHDGEAVLTSGDGVGVGENYHYIKGKFEFHQRVYCVYDFDENSDGRFFFYYFSTHFKKRVKQMSAKNSVDSVRMSMVTEMPIWLPPIAEQQRIADCLSSVDAGIVAEAEKLAALKIHKKGLMQQLFPSPEGD